eukprot:TRINITY_DN46543_c0_g1_i1.p1 TRINITY_DN46543_c0_g1~~TRINITY_DN46543_c0_g1_i1.p1  ORF type:complete len:511 (-),score=70.97 TRINITY_DN46543_c0_g1_i1:180-1712(-)
MLTQALCVFFAVILCSGVVVCQSVLSFSTTFVPRIIGTTSKDTSFFTQGVTFGYYSQFYESTGIRGQSQAMRMVSPGAALSAVFRLPSADFGEGIAVVNSHLFYLTWQARHGYVLSHCSIASEGMWSYSSEGWGLAAAASGHILFMTDGSATVTLWSVADDPSDGLVRFAGGADDFDVVDANGVMITNLNEAEVVGGELWVNVWRTTTIVRVDVSDILQSTWDAHKAAGRDGTDEHPHLHGSARHRPATRGHRPSRAAGRVSRQLTAMAVDGAALHQAAKAEYSGSDVLNGVAYDWRGDPDSVWMTGKLYPTYFRVTLPDDLVPWPQDIPRPAPSGVCDSTNSNVTTIAVPVASPPLADGGESAGDSDAGSLVVAIVVPVVSGVLVLCVAAAVALLAVVGVRRRQARSSHASPSLEDGGGQVVFAEAEDAAVCVPAGPVGRPIERSCEMTGKDPRSAYSPAPHMVDHACPPAAQHVTTPDWAVGGAGAAGGAPSTGPVRGCVEHTPGVYA